MNTYRHDLMNGRVVWIPNRDLNEQQHELLNRLVEAEDKLCRVKMQVSILLECQAHLPPVVISVLEDIQSVVGKPLITGKTDQ